MKLKVTLEVETKTSLSALKYSTLRKLTLLLHHPVEHKTIFLGFLNSEDGIGRLSRNAGKKLPLLSA
jgi:hypothetical protein